MYLKITILSIILSFFPIVEATQIFPPVVGMKTIYYNDLERQRPIIADVYYPIDKQQQGVAQQGPMIRAQLNQTAPILSKKGGYPLIVLSHGYGGSRQHLSWFAETLSDRGYIVAAVEHFGNTSHFDTPKIALRRWLRPQDISAFLDQFLEDAQWKDLIDHERVGFAGFSLGGLTGVWLVGGVADKYTKPVIGKSSIYELALGATQDDIDSINYEDSHLSFKDNRIRAAFLMAPAHGFSFSQNGLKDIRTPVFIVVGKEDKIAPLEENAAHYAQCIPTAQIKVLEGKVTHLAFRNAIQPVQKKFANHFEFELSPEVDVENIHRQTAILAIEFFKKTISSPPVD